MLLSNNPQFPPNHYETLSKYGAHDYLILAKFHNDWVKIADFLIKAYVLWKSELGCPVGDLLIFANKVRTVCLTFFKKYYYIVL